uniref:DUF5990 family protein n=1 Tax=Symbioplanes lichenis TaxID=1629072 RepID=UPI002738B9B7
GGGGVLGGGARGGGAASSGAASIGAADFAGFRRAKLMFGDVPGDLLRAAHEGNAVLIGRLGLTDAENLPVAARIRPPAIVWSIE